MHANHKKNKKIFLSVIHINIPSVRKGRAGCNMAGAGKARAPNKCGWLKRDRKESCGKRCYGANSGQHNYQL